jgi:hypothetical protein
VDPVPKFKMHSHSKGSKAKFTFNKTGAQAMGIQNTGDEYVVFTYDKEQAVFGIFLTDEITAHRFFLKARISKGKYPTSISNKRAHVDFQRLYGNVELSFRIEAPVQMAHSGEVFSVFPLTPLVGVGPDDFGDGQGNINPFENITAEEEAALEEQQIADSVENFEDWA